MSTIIYLEVFDSHNTSYPKPLSSSTSKQVCRSKAIREAHKAYKVYAYYQQGDVLQWNEYKRREGGEIALVSWSIPNGIA